MKIAGNEFDTRTPILALLAIALPLIHAYADHVGLIQTILNQIVALAPPPAAIMIAGILFQWGFWVCLATLSAGFSLRTKWPWTIIASGMSGAVLIWALRSYDDIQMTLASTTADILVYFCTFSLTAAALAAIISLGRKI